MSHKSCRIYDGNQILEDLSAILNENRIFLRGFQKTKKDRNNKKHGNILAIK